VKTLIYMSDEIKKPKPNPKRITVVQQGGKIKYSGNLKLMYDGKVLARIRFKPEGLQTAPSHHVRAWIETECEVIG
jgi:hypothetical protein